MHENGARMTARREFHLLPPLIRQRSFQLRTLVFLGRQNLTATIGAGLQVDVVRTAQFARVLVFGVGIGSQSVVGTTHVATRGRYFALRNSHVRLNLPGRRQTRRENNSGGPKEPPARAGLCPNTSTSSSLAISPIRRAVSPSPRRPDHCVEECRSAGPSRERAASRRSGRNRAADTIRSVRRAAR